MIFTLKEEPRNQVYQDILDLGIRKHLNCLLVVRPFFVKGFTHDLLLEAAVFLVSVKPIIMTYRNSQGVESIEKKLDLILSAEEYLEKALVALRQTNPVGSENT